MLTREEIRKTVKKALIFALTVLVVVTAFAVIRSIVHNIHVINPEMADVQPNES